MNYDEVARGCGAVGIKVDKEEDIPSAIERLLLNPELKTRSAQHHHWDYGVQKGSISM